MKYLNQTSDGTTSTIFPLMILADSSGEITSLISWLFFGFIKSLSYLNSIFDISVTGGSDMNYHA